MSDQDLDTRPVGHRSCGISQEEKHASVSRLALGAAV